MKVIKKIFEPVSPPAKFIIELDEEEARLLAVLGGFINDDTIRTFKDFWSCWHTDDISEAFKLLQLLKQNLRQAGEHKARWKHK